MVAPLSEKTFVNRAYHILDLYCIRLSNAAPFYKNYVKLHFDAKHLEKGLNRGDFWCFFLKKKVSFLANIECCPKFLEYALVKENQFCKDYQDFSEIFNIFLLTSAKRNLLKNIWKCNYSELNFTSFFYWSFKHTYKSFCLKFFHKFSFKM